VKPTSAGSSLPDALGVLVFSDPLADADAVGSSDPEALASGSDPPESDALATG